MSPWAKDAVQMAGAANTQKAREDLLRAELTEQGKFSELLDMNVPFAPNPEITLTSVQPQVRCFVRHQALTMSAVDSD